MRSCFFKAIVLCAVCLLVRQGALAQALLQQPVTLNCNNRPLGEVLQSIGRQGGFSFSYNSRIINNKKPVSIMVMHRPVGEILDKLFEGNYQYKEVAGHVILQPVNEKWYILSGYVQDASTGLAISDASVYERTQLIAANTNDKGYFRLRLRDKYPTAHITISKESYTDTTMVFSAGGEQVYNLPVRPATVHIMDSVVVRPRGKVSDNFFGRLFLSSRQRLQALNIAGFMANRPYQVSLVPGLGTHGSMSGQVVNKVSLNVIGGYTAGASGAEVGGVFNLTKDRVVGTQIAGVFNIVGGKTTGAELAGLYNGLQDSVEGVAVAGIMNTIKGNAEGVLVAGIVNYVQANSTGTHIAGIANVERGELKGIQIAGIANYARKLSGLQIGLVNIADSTDGYMLGLVNLSRNGYHKAVISANEILPLNVALKTGNRKLYTIVLSGMSFGNGNKAYSFGAGIGREFPLGKRLSVTTELTFQHLYLGDWDYANFLYRAQPDLNIKLNKFLTVFAGPAISIYQARAAPANEGYKHDIAPYDPMIKMGKDMNGWIGWHVGLVLF